MPKVPFARGKRADRSTEPFRYLGFSIDPAARSLTCRYGLGEHVFTEVFGFPGSEGPGGGREQDWGAPAVTEAARILFLLAGVSYYKAGAPAVIDLGSTAVTDRERAFLREYYVDGLGEFAFRATPRLDLSDIEIVGPRLARTAPAPYAPTAGTPLIPFGGGVDSIVSVELLRALPETDRPAGAALFVVNRPGDRFDAIEEPAKVTGLPVVRAERMLDEKILRSAELGFLNGHVPVTGIISATAVLAAALQGRDAVVMSNEWSASVGTVEVEGRSINHQYSKSLSFEAGLRAVLADAIGGGLVPGAAGVDYFSLLRPFSELWIAEHFAGLGQYFATFRSCNRAFHIDHEKRLDHWCGVCDKCAFVDLILSPFVAADQLRAVFIRAGKEPIENADMVPNLGMLLGLIPDAKPWECVGDVHECRVAAQIAITREDRLDSRILPGLVEYLPKDLPDVRVERTRLLAPMGTHHIPARYLPDVLRSPVAP